MNENVSRSYVCAWGYSSNGSFIRNAKFMSPSRVRRLHSLSFNYNHACNDTYLIDFDGQSRGIKCQYKLRSAFSNGFYRTLGKRIELMSANHWNEYSLSYRHSIFCWPNDETAINVLNTVLASHHDCVRCDSTGCANQMKIVTPNVSRLFGRDIMGCDSSRAISEWLLAKIVAVEASQGRTWKSVCNLFPLTTSVRLAFDGLFLYTCSVWS